MNIGLLLLAWYFLIFISIILFMRNDYLRLNREMESAIKIAEDEYKEAIRLIESAKS